MRKLFLFVISIFVLGILYLPLPPLKLRGGSLGVISPILAQTLPSGQRNCPPGETPYTPGGVCAKNTDYIEFKFGNYVLTCQDTPTIRLRRSTLDSFGAGIMPVTVDIDISQAELGGLGPNQDAYQNQSSDYLAQYYPFNALFDKPITTLKNPREASRTFWRFMGSMEQANAKASFLKQFRANDPPINNDSITFFSPVPPPNATPTIAPTPTPPADTTYGFNWGYGHIDQTACQQANGRAVTFLLPLGAGEDPNLSMLKDYKSCYAGATTRVVRITDFDAKNDPAEFAKAAAGFQQVFGSDYVELGNELNNLSLEYPNCGTDLGACGTNYAKQFKAFRDVFKGNLAAAALDTSNSDYDAAAFISGAITAYKSASFITANSYQLAGCAAGYDPRRCTKSSYQWVAEQIGAKNIILTEYGLAPGNDTNLNDVINFYKTNIPTDVLAVTPLIRNPCSGATGQWLRMIDYKFYDVEDSLVNPTSCKAGPSSTLYPDSMTYLELNLRLTDCLKQTPVCKDYLDSYNNLNPRVKAAYDALFPFNPDNVRGYQVMNDQIAKENLPYVNSIFQGLIDPNYGLINAFSPSWLNTIRYQKMVDKQYYPPQLVPQILENNDAVNAVLITLAKALDAGTCKFHNGIYLPSPLTYPDKNLSQTVAIPYTVTEKTHTTTDPVTGLPIDVTKYTLTGQADGKPVAVLNNPMLEMIDIVTYKGDQSFVGMLLPSFAYHKPLERDMVAPIAQLTSQEDGVTAKTEMLGVGHASIDRLGGQTNATLCRLRNQWLMPSALQDKTVKCDNMGLQDMINGNTGVDVPANQ